MIVWAVIPSYSVKRAEEATGRWGAKGYRTLLVINRECIPSHRRNNLRADIAVTVGAYEGYYRTLNVAAAAAFTRGKADVVVCAGDRILPPEQRAHDLAAAFAVKFPGGVGVMQPAAHIPPTEADGGARDRLWLESPWIGKPFWRAVYGGHGPYWGRYFQYFGNRELGHVAARMGALWLNPGAGSPRNDDPPDFIQAHNRKEYWDRDAAVWTEREKLGFPADVWDTEGDQADAAAAPNVNPKIWTPWNGKQ